MIVPLWIARSKSILAVEKAMAGSKKVLLVAQKNAHTEDPNPEDIYEVGTIGEILQVVKNPDGSIKVLIEGTNRAKIIRYVNTRGIFEVKTEKIKEPSEKTPEIEALMRTVIKLFQKYGELNPKIPREFLSSINDLNQPGRLADVIASHVRVKMEAKQQILESFQHEDRLKKIIEILMGEVEILGVEKKIQGRVTEQIGKTQKQFYLQEQMKAIEKELGKGSEEGGEFSELKVKIKEAKMTKEAEEKANKELEKLTKMHSMSPEATVIRNYLDWLIGVPWSKETQDKLNIKKSEEILNQDHYGLEKAKERILEFLAVRKLVKKLKGPILCFVGPPGVGKTSLGRSIARALGRKFIRVSLGGVRDEAEIRGHRRTYIGALPGKIIQSLRKVGSRNPVFLLDEVDKMSVDFRGDPSSALLEVLDPEQNHEFNDHYLEVDFDLSNVLFIATANVIHNIPSTLLDRFEVINFSGYTEIEQVKIANQFLITKQLKANGLNSNLLEISDKTILSIVRHYTREAGVRNLEREIASICRKTAKLIVEKKRTKKIKVLPCNLSDFLGNKKFRYNKGKEKEEIGVVTGLAWTEVGGEILSIEVAVMAGKGELILTGQLGDVMKESGQASLSFIRSKAKELGLAKNFYKNIDIHIHVPEGGIPKDGPSAGVAMAVSLASALTKKPVKKDIAMTGEITLRGNVLPVGGIKSKVLAAHRSNIKTVILPQENKKDLDDIPLNVRKKIKFFFVKNTDQIFKKVGILK
ncbi:endopeptidase La [bacterium]|nr:endopeptidase La [bacterium]